jgi:hypothetical protein
VQQMPARDVYLDGLLASSIDSLRLLNLRERAFPASTSQPCS